MNLILTILFITTVGTRFAFANNEVENQISNGDQIIKQRVNFLPKIYLTN